MKLVFTIMLGLASLVHLYCQNEKTLLFDLHSSAIANGENLHSIHQLFTDFEQKHIKDKYWKEDDFIGKGSAIYIRLLKGSITNILDNIFLITQHEVFGHGFRFREYGFRNNSYNIRPLSGGFARRGVNINERQLGTHEDIAISMGGMDATLC